MEGGTHQVGEGLVVREGKKITRKKTTGKTVEKRQTRWRAVKLLVEAGRGAGR